MAIRLGTNTPKYAVSASGSGQAQSASAHSSSQIGSTGSVGSTGSTQSGSVRSTVTYSPKASFGTVGSTPTSGSSDLTPLSSSYKSFVDTWKRKKADAKLQSASLDNCRAGFEQERSANIAVCNTEIQNLKSKVSNIDEQMKSIQKEIDALKTNNGKTDGKDPFAKSDNPKADLEAALDSMDLDDFASEFENFSTEITGDFKKTDSNNKKIMELTDKLNNLSAEKKKLEDTISFIGQIITQYQSLNFDNIENVIAI